MLCRCERRQSEFQMGSSFMCFNPPSWCVGACLRGLLFFEMAMGQEGHGLLFYQKFKQGYTLGITLSQSHKHLLANWLSCWRIHLHHIPFYLPLLCLRFTSSKFSFFFHLTMSFSRISLCPPSLLFIVLFSLFSLSNFIVAWAVS